MKLMENNM